MIYFFENYDSVSCENFLGFLPEKRREKCLRLRQKRDRENCVISYMILKQALKENGVENFELDTDENGKPFIKNSEWYFNISHCREGVAVVLSRSPAGIDIQDIGPYKEAVARRVCSPAEIELIENSENADREFTRIWTLKESAAKCDGKGIKILKDFFFENCGNSFRKYDRFFTTFEKKNCFISVCGEEEFSDITEIKNLEVF